MSTYVVDEVAVNHYIAKCCRVCDGWDCEEDGFPCDVTPPRDCVHVTRAKELEMEEIEDLNEWLEAQMRAIENTLAQHGRMLLQMHKVILGRWGEDAAETSTSTGGAGEKPVE